jgi:hypothetical protein
VKVIAFSLWGAGSRYTLGALQNASLAKIVYPDWVCRFYVGQSTPRIIVDMLEEFDNVQIIKMPEEGDWTGMFWRFLAASDPHVEVMISRDCDSRLWFREKAAVDEWLASDKDFHIMRDNSQHGAAILGGMWGVRGDLLQDIQGLISDYSKGDFWQVDQNFLRDIVYPRVESKAFVHDEFFSGHSFPTAPRDDNHFVGQAYAGTGKVLHLEDVYFQDYMRESEYA